MCLDLGDVSGALMATTNMQMQTFISQPTAFAVNQRDEVRDLHGIAGALGSSVAIPCAEYLVQGIVRAIREGW